LPRRSCSRSSGGGSATPRISERESMPFENLIHERPVQTRKLEQQGRPLAPPSGLGPGLQVQGDQQVRRHHADDDSLSPSRLQEGRRRRSSPYRRTRERRDRQGSGLNCHVQGVEKATVPDSRHGRLTLKTPQIVTTHRRSRPKEVALAAIRTEALSVHAPVLVRVHHAVGHSVGRPAQTEPGTRVATHGALRGRAR
jgi:hypothetical protein